ncbi:MAG: response regulator transcription factor, partial [Flavisolibacter sp.]|nr:response regulator transcription factor [Flavisolibacter sp.]
MLPPTLTATPTKPVRVVIADDHQLLVDGFYCAMKKHPQILMAGYANDGGALVNLTDEIRPDVVFTDIQMPVMDGIAATREIVQRFPYIKVIGFSGFLDEGYITDMMEAGAMGYLLKNDDYTVILKAIENVMQGKVFYSHEVSNKLAAMMQRTGYNPTKPFDMPHFSELELAVVKEICNGLISKEIA